MGFFSWNTQDTKRSIANHYSDMPVFTVFMFDDKGNKWQEDNYDGYGEFGGKDYFELLAEMNGLEPNRDLGIDLFYDKSKTCITPNLAEDPNWQWINEAPEDCPNQGYFYPNDDEDLEEDDWGDESDDDFFIDDDGNIHNA